MISNILINKHFKEKAELKFMVPKPHVSAPPIEHCKRHWSEVCYNLVHSTRLSISEVNDIYAVVIPLIDEAYICGVRAERARTETVERE